MARLTAISQYPASDSDHFLNLLTPSRTKHTRTPKPILKYWFYFINIFVTITVVDVYWKESCHCQNTDKILSWRSSDTQNQQNSDMEPKLNLSQCRWPSTYYLPFKTLQYKLQKSLVYFRWVTAMSSIQEHLPCWYLPFII